MLDLLVLGSGAVLMSLELLGSRLLAPYFGNSLVVWGSLISVFLSALSLGYLLGGRAADRWPQPKVLIRVVLAAGLWVAVLPWFAAPLLKAMADRGLDPRVATLTASVLLFLGPSVLMGMVSPLAIRLRARGVEHIGQDAGGLYALSTLGSIAGTIATSFWLIPALGTRALLETLGLVLLLLAGGLGLRERRRWETALAAVLVTVLVLGPATGSGAGGTTGGSGGNSPGTDGDTAAAGRPVVKERMGGRVIELTTLYEADSLYHHIRVMEGDGSRYLRFDNSWQSGMYVGDPFRTRFDYTDFFSLADALGPQPKRVLFIGLGGGSTPKHFWKTDPNVQIDVAELDPEVVRVARQYFSVPDDPRLRITVTDGRQFLAGTDQRYDLICLDAYYAESIPFQLTTKEFLGLVKSHLAPGGVVEANLIGAYEGDKSDLYRSFHKTFVGVFPTLYSFPVYWNNDPATVRNIMLAATANPRLSPELLTKRAGEAAQAAGVSNLAEYAASEYRGPIATDDVPLLTDDHAPVDNLLRLQE
ncbi:MAG: spermidine synthase [Symbiobacteriia bacterium]